MVLKLFVTYCTYIYTVYNFFSIKLGAGSSVHKIIKSEPIIVWGIMMCDSVFCFCFSHSFPSFGEPVLYVTFYYREFNQHKSVHLFMYLHVFMHTFSLKMVTFSQKQHGRISTE